jgi:hypothetical protein
MAIQNFKPKFLEVLDARIHHFSELVETHRLLLGVVDPWSWRLHRSLGLLWCWLRGNLLYSHHVCCLALRSLMDWQLLEHTIIVDKLSFISINPVLEHLIVILSFLLLTAQGLFDLFGVYDLILVEIQSLIIFLLSILFRVFLVIPSRLFGSSEDYTNSVPFELVLVAKGHQCLQRKVQKWLLLLFDMLLLLLELLLNILQLFEFTKLFIRYL